jgi:deoxyribodipyrimidine photo-lyase
MRSVPDTWLFEPWMMPQRELTDATQMPEIVTPLVDLAAATKTAKHRVHERRRDPEVKAGKKAIVEKHASRQGFRSMKKPAKEQTTDTQQMGFDF